MVLHEGAGALAAIDDYKPDVILLDIGMPGLSGLDVAKRVRARNGKKVQLVALTGWGQEADRERSAAAGFDSHLVKPVSVEQLTKVLAGPSRP